MDPHIAKIKSILESPLDYEQVRDGNHIKSEHIDILFDCENWSIKRIQREFENNGKYLASLRDLHRLGTGFFYVKDLQKNPFFNRIADLMTGKEQYKRIVTSTQVLHLTHPQEDVHMSHIIDCAERANNGPFSDLQMVASQMSLPTFIEEEYLEQIGPETPLLKQSGIPFNDIQSDPEKKERFIAQRAAIHHLFHVQNQTRIFDSLIQLLTRRQRDSGYFRAIRTLPTRKEFKSLKGTPYNQYNLDRDNVPRPHVCIENMFNGKPELVLDITYSQKETQNNRGELQVGAVGITKELHNHLRKANWIVEEQD